MKIKNVLGALLLMMVSPLVLATEFKVVNLVTGYIQIKPEWTNRESSEWDDLFYGEEKAKGYDSGRHHLKRITWRAPGFGCYIANIENDKVLGLIDRLRKNVVIRLYGNGQYSINLSSGELVEKDLEPGNC